LRTYKHTVSTWWVKYRLINKQQQQQQQQKKKKKKKFFFFFFSSSSCDGKASQIWST
jgi:hypothetical protein